MRSRKRDHTSNTQLASPECLRGQWPSVDFGACCEKAGIRPTRRQANKFRRREGLAYTWAGGKQGKPYKGGAKE